MSDFVRLKNERQLVILETQVVPIDLEIQGYVETLRDLLDPLLPTSELQLKTAADIAVKAAVRQIDLKAKLAGIVKLKGMLGKE